MPGVLSFLIAVVYWPGLVSAAVAPRWAVVIVGCSLALALGKAPLMRAPSLGHLFGALFLLYALLSTAWSLSPLDSIGSEAQLLLGLFPAFVLGARTKDMTPVWVGLALGGWVLLGSYFVVDTDFSRQMYGHGGVFLNRDFAGAFAAAAAVGALYGLSRYPRLVQLGLFLGPLAALLYSQCVGAVLALVAAVVVAEGAKLPRIRRVWYWLAALGLVGVTVTAALVLIPEKATNVMIRFGKWDYVTANLSVFGRGANTMGAAFPFISSDNDLIDLLWDFGIGSVPLIALVIYALWANRAAAERWVLLVLIFDGFSSTPLRLPATAYIAALVLGRLCADGVCVLDLGFERRTNYPTHLQRLSSFATRCLQRVGCGRLSLR